MRDRLCWYTPSDAERLDPPAGFDTAGARAKGRAMIERLLEKERLGRQEAEAALRDERE
jgi:hypothetical protein